MSLIVGSRPVPATLPGGPAAITMIEASILQRPYVLAITPDRTLSLPPGLAEPGGVTLGGGFLWVTDSTKNRVWRIDRREKGRVPPTPIDLRGLRNPRAVVYVAEHDTLWMLADAPNVTPAGGGMTDRRRGPLDSKGQRIFKVPVVEGPAFGAAKALRIEPRAVGQPLTGLAWDGEKLWLSAAGGLCACVYGIDEDQDEDGAVRAQQRFFPRCEPAGVAVDRVHRRLWLVADQGHVANRDHGRDPWLLERLLVKGIGGGPSWTPLYHNQRFLILRSPDDAPITPRDIVVDGDEIWIVDARLPGLNRRGASRLLRYRVR